MQLKPILESDSARRTEATSRPVGSIATRDVLVCAPDTGLVGAAELMHEARCSSIIVIDDHKPVGIWTERDALKVDFTDRKACEKPIKHFMSSPVRSIVQTETTAMALEVMRQERLRHLLVVERSGALYGIVTQTDLVFAQGIETFLVLRQINQVMMNRDVLTVPPSMRLSDLAQAMWKRNFEAAVVGDTGDGRGPGIITERDVMRGIATGLTGGVADDLASRPLITLQDRDSLLQARNLMITERVRHLAICNDRAKIIGLLSFTDIFASIQSEYVSRLSTLLQERDAALVNSQKHLTLAKKVIDVSSEAIVITDSQGRIDFVNPAFTRVTGYEADEIIGENTSKLRSGRHEREFYADMWKRIKEDGHWQGEIWNKRKSGEIYPEWLNITAVPATEEGEELQYVAVFTDISDRKRDESLIRKLSYYDQLTGLPNRRLFRDRVNMALYEAKRTQASLAVMYLDVDTFKRITDSIGHKEGDRILNDLAKRVQDLLGTGETLARISGDEFAVLIPRPGDADEAARVVETLLGVFKEPFSTPEMPVHLTGSFGVALFPEDGTDAETLLRNADTAMARAKHKGGNQFAFYTPALSERTLERLSLDGELRAAIDKNQLFLVYQPKLCARTGNCAGLEALIRWNHPRRGLVSPADFIPLAEETGFITTIGDWVLKETCRQIGQWQMRGIRPGRVAINVSPHQFRTTDVVRNVADALQINGIDGSCLEIELTESVLMEDLEEVRETLNRLKRMKLTIAIDDLGTGFSSLSYLKSLPIDSLKIDRSFIWDMFSGSDDGGLVKTMTSMARNLGLKSVAEGVETERQSAFLAENGCDFFQGFLLGRPMPAEALESWMRCG